MSDSWNGFRIVVDGISYKAVDLGILMRDGNTDPVLPDTRDKLLEVSGRNGAYYFGADFAARRILVPCVFAYASNETELQSDIETLASLLIDAVTKKPKKIEIIFESNPQEGYYVYLSGTMPLIRRVMVAEFDLPFIAPDPWAHVVSAYT